MVTPVDPLLREIEQAIERKGQVILYGPPALERRTTRADSPSPGSLQRQGLAEKSKRRSPTPEKFKAAERRLSTSQVSGVSGGSSPTPKSGTGTGSSTRSGSATGTAGSGATTRT